MDFVFNSFGLFGIMLGVIPVLGIIIFIAVFILFGVTIAKHIKQKNYNRSQPLLTVRAKVVSKRSDVRGYGGSNYGAGHGHHMSGGTSHTSYYATFEVESGDRMELRIPHSEAGYLIEGDAGSLSFQGIEFKGFTRQ